MERCEESNRSTVMSDVRGRLVLLIQEAIRQGCFFDMVNFLDVFVVMVMCTDTMISGYIQTGQVTIPEVYQWLEDMLNLGGGRGGV